MRRKDYEGKSEPNYILWFFVILWGLAILSLLDDPNEPLLKKNPTSTPEKMTFWSPSQQKWDDEVAAAGGFEAWKRKQDLIACWDACDGLDDPFCEICAQLSNGVISKNTLNNTRNCSSCYPTICIPNPPPDLDCKDLGHKNFSVLNCDPHWFDGDGDGIGCEPYN